MNQVFTKASLVSLSLAALVIFSPNQASAQSTSEIMYFQQEATGNIYTIGPTGVSTLLASESGHYWNGAAYDPYNSLVYVDDVGTANELGSLGDSAAFNKIYSFDPRTPAAGVTFVGTISSGTSVPSLFDAAFHVVAGVPVYYSIPIATTTLNTYTFPSTGGITVGTSYNLGGLFAPNTASATPVSVAGLLLGDVDFVGSDIYIYGLALTQTSGTTYETNMLYEYALSNLNTPLLSVTEGAVGGAQIGAGLSYNAAANKLFATDTANNLYTIDPSSGAETLVGPISGVDTGGNGDYTVAIVPEPAPFYGIGLIVLLAAAVKFSRRFRAGPKLTPVAV